METSCLESRLTDKSIELATLDIIAALTVIEDLELKACIYIAVH